MSWIRGHDRSGKPLLRPAPEREEEQRELIRSLVRNLAAHAAAHGYVRGRSPWTCLAPHVGCRWMIALDIQRAFESTTVAMVRRGLYLAGLTTQQTVQITDLCMVDNGLPRGAPTSPALFNVTLWTLDDRLLRYADTYTRYSDNMILSGEGLFFEGAIRSEIRVFGYAINERKSRLMIRGRTAMEVLGISVGEYALSNPRRQRRRERAILHQRGER